MTTREVLGVSRKTTLKGGALYMGIPFVLWLPSSSGISARVGFVIRDEQLDFSQLFCPAKGMRLQLTVIPMI